MTRLRKTAFAGVFAALAFNPASAALVSFSGDGNFSNITGCPGGANGCSITGGGNILDMSGTNNSTLTITDISNNVLTNTDDTEIGRITWVNRASSGTDQNFRIDYTFTLSFTSPAIASDSKLFNLKITQPTNPTADNVFNISNAVLADLGPFVLPGVTVSDIKFSLFGAGTYDGSRWVNPEHSTSHLVLTADFTAAVPEPSTWAMMLIGFAGLGYAARRRRQALAA